MKNERSIVLVKSVHTIIWAVMASASVYILYAGLAGIADAWLWVSVALLAIESVTLLINKWTCPLTPLAMKYTDDRRDNFDIYIPEVLARYNKLIFGLIAGIGFLLVVFNAVRGAAM